MAESKPDSTFATSYAPDDANTRRSVWPLGFLILSVLMVPIAAAVLLYRLDPFDPAPLPIHELTQQAMAVPRLNGRMLQGSELIGVGHLWGPEDLAYDPGSQLVYTGCADGWVKRVTLNESAANSVVENWVYSGGRPLGLALGLNNEVLIADADKGLLKVSGDGVVKLLTDEAEGLKFKLTDGVDVAQDGIIYFTDASYKYSLKDFIWDILEGKPHGRFMRFDPSTKETKVLVRDLYFPNGVAVSPDQNFVVFCETVMMRCRKYYIQGNREGSVDIFIDNLPGMPDNIKYDGEGHYWIALATATTFYWDLALRYPFIRKCLAIVERYIGRPDMEKNGGVLAVDLDGKPTTHYYDPALSMVSSGIKIGDHLYCGSVIHPYVIRLNLSQHPALSSI